MYPCKKCYQNNWNFNKSTERQMIAECNECGNIVKWGKKETKNVSSKKDKEWNEKWSKMKQQEDNQDFLSSL